MKIEFIKETDSGDIIRLLEGLILYWHEKPLLLVPEGFECDGCSVPQFLWATVSPAVDSRTIRGAVAHDYLYRNAPEGWTRKEADKLFYDLIREDGLGLVRSQKAYWGVRLFGSSSWKGGK